MSPTEAQVLGKDKLGAMESPHSLTDSLGFNHDYFHQFREFAVAADFGFLILI